MADIKEMETAAAAAAQTAPVLETPSAEIPEAEIPKMEVPTLELNPDVSAQLEEIKVPETKEELFRMQNFTEEEKTQINEFAEKIDLHDTNTIVTYGAGAQKRLADFSDTALENIRNKDIDQVGVLIGDLVTDLKYDPDEKKGLFGLLGKGTHKAEKLMEHYSKVEKSVEEVQEALEKHQQTLLKDIAIQDMLFENNKAFFKELTMYIAAGKMALQKALNEELPQLQAKAKASGLSEEAQEAEDFASMCERFEKKLHDLELTRTICLQNAPQIRLIQNNAIILSDKINSTIVNTLPLWKNQMVITLGMAHSKEAIKAQNMVTNTTNEILEKNAEMLHQTTVDIATENERGIVDLETLQRANSELIATLDDIMKIQQEGKDKRIAAEAELARIESELKNKMLEMSTAAR